MIEDIPTTEQAIVTAFVELLTAVPGMQNANDGRKRAFDETEMPAANVFTPQVEADSVGASHMDQSLKLNIVLHLAEAEPQRRIRSMRAAVYRAIGDAEREGSGPFAVPGVIAVEDPAAVQKVSAGGDMIGSAQIALTVTYRAPRWAM